MPFRRLLFTIGLVLITGTWFIFPVGIFAAEDTCDCYCNIEGQGATQYPKAATKVTADRCQELCREGGYSVAACAMDPSQKPQYNIMCFTPDECKSQGGISTATGSGTQVQPGECKQGMFYCYPDPSKRMKATLQVAIGGLTATGDLGEYISEVYKWMLGVGTTIAIVFMMVAGLRWTLGGVNAEQIGKAKKTITNALVGLILLLSTYLIIYTVNPYLVRLQVPAFPMIKTVALLDASTSCGFLSGVWGTKPYLVKNGAPYDSPHAPPGLPYTLANPTAGAKCGSVADVVDAPEGEELQNDMTCTFDYCPDLGDRCIQGVGSSQCVTCMGVNSNTSDETGLLPSVATCKEFAAPTEFTSNGYIGKANYCILLQSLSDSNLAYCGKMQTDCLPISECEKYNAATVLTTGVVGSNTLKGWQDGKLFYPATTLQSICEEDLCRAGTRSKKTCTYDDATGCVGK